MWRNSTASKVWYQNYDKSDFNRYFLHKPQITCACVVSNKYFAQISRWLDTILVMNVCLHHMMISDCGSFEWQSGIKPRVSECVVNVKLTNNLDINYLTKIWACVAALVYQWVYRNKFMTNLSTIQIFFFHWVINLSIILYLKITFDGDQYWLGSI